MAAAQPQMESAAAAAPPHREAKQNGKSSPISARGSPPVSPVPAAPSPVLGGVINLTKANGKVAEAEADASDDHDINVDEDETDEEVKNIVKA